MALADRRDALGNSDIFPHDRFAIQALRPWRSRACGGTPGTIGGRSLRFGGSAGVSVSGGWRRLRPNLFRRHISATCVVSVAFATSRSRSGRFTRIDRTPRRMSASFMRRGRAPLCLVRFVHPKKSRDLFTCSLRSYEEVLRSIAYAHRAYEEVLRGIAYPLRGSEEFPCSIACPLRSGEEVMRSIGWELLTCHRPHVLSA